MTGTFEVLVERPLKMRNSLTGLKEDLVIQIGHPYVTTAEGDAACPVAIKGLGERIADIHGVDSLDAIKLAIEFAESVIREKAAEGSLYWPNGEEYL